MKDCLSILYIFILPRQQIELLTFLFPKVHYNNCTISCNNHTIEFNVPDMITTPTSFSITVLFLKFSLNQSCLISRFQIWIKPSMFLFKDIVDFRTIGFRTIHQHNRGQSWLNHLKIFTLWFNSAQNSISDTTKSFISSWLPVMWIPPHA